MSTAQGRRCAVRDDGAVGVTGEVSAAVEKEVTIVGLNQSECCFCCVNTFFDFAFLYYVLTGLIEAKGPQMRLLLALTTCAIIFSATNSFADTLYVKQIGDGGWYSDDTRCAGKDLVGLNNTQPNARLSTVAPSAADDAQIAKQLQFVSSAPGNKAGLMLTFDASSSGKATLSVINTTTGFASGAWYTDFYLNFERYRSTPTNTTVKIDVQSTKWASSQLKTDGSAFVATHSGEAAWDLSLVYQGNFTPNDTWEDINLTASGSTVTTATGSTVSSPTINNGTWKIYAQSGNTYFTAPSANKTLADWAADPIWGSILFGGSAKVTCIQIGAGSFSSASTGYVTYIETNLLNGGDAVMFVPEPGTLAMLAGAIVGLVAYVLRRRNG
jgi:hypothetical protein